MERKKESKAFGEGNACMHENMLHSALMQKQVTCFWWYMARPGLLECKSRKRGKLRLLKQQEKARSFGIQQARGRI